MNLSETVISGGSVFGALDQVEDTGSWGWFLDGVPSNSQKPPCEANDEIAASNASVVHVVGVQDLNGPPGWVLLLG